MGRRIAVAVAATLLIGGASASSASASTLPTNCANFGTTLASAGAGDTIVLSGLCTGVDAHFTLPATANLTIEGAATGTNGFDGTGVPSPALASAANPNDPDGLTLRNLTFENYGSSSAVDIVTRKGDAPYSFVGDTFAHNSNTTGDGGGLHVLVEDFLTNCTVTGPFITISGSTFTGNSAAGLNNFLTEASGGGGGALLELDCISTSPKPSIQISGNTFSGNTVPAASTNSREGGGLFVASGRFITSPVPTVVQSGNLFSGNSVTGSGGNYAGGGEFTFGTDISSTGDMFVGNSLAGPSASTVSSEGGGLSTRTGGNCTTPQGSTSTASNLVVAGNTIGAPSGTGTGGEGAGIYAGCTPGSGGYDLTLINSTVSGNQATGTGAVAGADGEATDLLHLKNTILIGNQGGSDLGGFGASDGANADAANSDVCAIGGSTPFAGAGNICANAALVNAPAGDVHETPTSPTIDAGSNAFVTTTTDVFGAPRIAQGKPGDAAIVDIGAAEVPSDAFSIGKVKGKTLYVNVTSPGSVTVSQAGAGGSAAVAAGKKKKKRLLNRSSASGGPGTVAVHLALTKKAKKQLKTKGKVKVKATVTFSPTGGIPNTESTKLTVKGKKKR